MGKVTSLKTQKMSSMSLSTLMGLALTAVLSMLLITNAHAGSHPQLVINAQDVQDMRVAIKLPGQFQDKFVAQQRDVDAQILQQIDVPIPKDGGGGITHERHKANYKLMYNAGVLYQLTQDKKYANYVKEMLFEYAKMYPTLPLHPKRKSRNEGKLFWQGLNEAVWLVYTIQGYDFIYDALTSKERKVIEQGIIRPVALFLSQESPHTFNKVHNHGTWATAAVGMTGYVIDEQDWVEKALYDLEKSGKGGFLKQLDELFSPQGYYNEGPYYQRYALMPFVTFAKAIEVNEPQRKIFEYRDGVLLKAIDTTIQLSYNGLFFPINDAIKDKGIDTIELVNGVTIAYGLTKNAGLLDIAQRQNNIILTGDGLKVAQGIAAGKTKPYVFKTLALGDGKNADQGALVIMRKQDKHQQALVFKATAQGLGHGHFDKLSWLFFDHGNEIVSDYGAARYLNIEAKYGGRYLPENKSYAHQTVAHNTLVVDQTSHFKGITKVGNRNHPTLLFFAQQAQGTVSAAMIDTAYQGVEFTRTMGLINVPSLSKPLAIDIVEARSSKEHQYDLPLHYKGQLIETNFAITTSLNQLSSLGNANGYQHLWLKGQAAPTTPLMQITWLNDNGQFYSHSSVSSNNTQVLFTQLGANDPNFNLRQESAFILRTDGAKNHRVLSVLESHGEYNPSKEFTVSARTMVKDLSYQKTDGNHLIELTLNDGKHYLLAIKSDDKSPTTFIFKGQNYSAKQRFKLFDLTAQ